MDELTSLSTLFTTLACMALSPGLHSMLIFDAPYTGLQQIAALLESLLAATSDRPVRRYQLNAEMQDDDTWGSLWLPGRGSKGRPLLFSPQRNAHELQLITIADLAQLNLSAARSCIMLIGSPVAHLERNGEHQQWHPEQCWLAACESDAVGRISPHLLDRFALRLSWKKLMPQYERDLHARSAWLHTHVPQQSSIEDIILPSKYIQQVQQAAQRQPTIAPEVLEYLTAYFSNNTLPEHYSARRELALARFACALARLEGNTTLTEEHVDAAAHILGLTPHAFTSDSQETASDRAPENGYKNMSAAYSIRDEISSSSTEQPTPVQQQSVLVSEDTALGQFGVERLCEDPYPEDSTPIEREAASLTIPRSSSPTSRLGRGPIVGVEESDTLHDLALFSTILAATKFQKVRGRQPGEPLRFEPIDLRRYRRGFTSEYQLVLVLDYTSVRDNVSWHNALLPYLHEAYIKRAGISIVKIGAQDASSLLRAEVLQERGLLVPRVGQALLTERGQGSPTPLAHGLQLTLDHLRRLLQHGRDTVTHVTLLVVSDGRGNVPLMWSANDSIGNEIITDEGVEDALTIARQISTMQRVEAIVLHPPTRQHPALPRLLAEALGASIAELPLDDDAEEAQA
jgi:magnesium chelatase subunit D